MEEQQARWNAEKEELESRVAALESEVADGEAECASQAWVTQQHKERMAAVQDKCDALADEVGGAELKHKAMMLELKDKCTMIGADNKTLEARLKASDDEVEALRETLDKYEAQHKELEHLFREQQRECNREKERSAKLEEVEQDRDTLREQLSMLKQQIKQGEAEHAKHAAAVKATQRRKLQKLKSLRQDLDAERESTVHWMQMTKQLNQIYNEAEQSFHKRLADRDRRIAGLKDQIVAYAKEEVSSSREQTPRHSTSRMAEVIGDALPKLQEIRSSYKSQIALLMHRVRELEGLLNATNQKCTELKASNEKYQTELIEMTLKHSSLAANDKKGKGTY